VDAHPVGAYNPAGRLIMTTRSGHSDDGAGRVHLPWWVWAAVVLCVTLGVLGYTSIISLPGLKRAAIGGNEASAIGYVQAVASAERLAAQFNKGYFLPPSCLADPSQCPPAVAPQPLLAAALTESYSMFFRVAAPASPDEIAARGAAARSIKTWVLVVMPRQPGVTGTRVFCTDTSGGIFFTPDSRTLPDPSGGRCNGAHPLQ
jgi:hypothetical protein